MGEKGFTVGTVWGGEEGGVVGGGDRDRDSVVGMGNGLYV